MCSLQMINNLQIVGHIECCDDSYLYSGVPSLFFFFEGAILIGPSPIFSEHWALPNRIASFYPQLQIRNKCSPFMPYLFSSYTGELNLGKPYGTKLKCFWEHLGNLRNPMGTHWEQKGGNRKPAIQPSSPPKKKKQASS